jgi:hypothetical protein
MTLESVTAPVVDAQTNKSQLPHTAKSKDN